MQKISNAELNRPDVGSFKTQVKNKIIVVLDHIRSAHNVGSVFRTSDAFAVHEIFLVGITPTPDNREVLKTALGATESVSWKFFKDTDACLEELENRKIQIVIVEQVTGATDLELYQPDSNEFVALVFGNEVNGVSNDFVSAAHGAVVIPQFGTKHSLNVSVAAGIILWHLVTHANKKAS